MVVTHGTQNIHLEGGQPGTSWGRCERWSLCGNLSVVEVYHVLWLARVISPPSCMLSEPIVENMQIM